MGLRYSIEAKGCVLAKTMISDQALESTRRHESGASNTFRLTDTPPLFVRGEGAWLYTESGERYLDLVCGSGTTNLGHAHPAHRQAIEEALESGILHTGTRLPSIFRARLYESLTSILPKPLDCFQLGNSGAEAVESAIKAAQYVTGRRRVLSFEGGYHGRTLGALSVTHASAIRKPFSTLDSIVGFVPYPYLDDPVGPVHDVGHCLKSLSSRMDTLAREGDTPAAVIVEPIQGVGGVIAPPESFMQGVRALCDENGVLLIADEIWSGFGRTGSWFSFSHSGVVPDLVVMGKALSGGLPLSAVAGPADILKAWPPGMHTSTFQGNPLACAMAVANIEAISQEGLLERAKTLLEATLADSLRVVAGQAGVHATRIAGAEAGIELVGPDGKPDRERLIRIQQACLAERMLVYGGGRHGNVLMLLPPLIVSTVDLQAALKRLIAIIRSS